MQNGNRVGSLRKLILMTISMTILSTGCSHFQPAPIECKRPNLVQKTGWKEIRRALINHPDFGPAIRWISEILEEDCFPKVAEEVRGDADD